MDMVTVGGGGSDAVARRRTRSVACPGCGTVLDPVWEWQMYCSDACRAEAWRRRQRTGVHEQARLDFTPAASELAHTVRGRETKAARILARLREGPANSLELLRVGGIRYSARIHELRAQLRAEGLGRRITTEEHADFAVYRLEVE